MIRPFLLASGSPRRQAILRQIGLDFKVLSTDVDETPLPGTAVRDIAGQLAMRKAMAASKQVAGIACLGCDTVVISAEKALGKPADPGEARRMLRSLSGQTHQVITGIALAQDARILAEASETTLVEFRSITDPELDDYIASGEPFDKAGAYGIQGLGARFVRRIEGCYYNVVGLPMAATQDMLNRFLEL